ncbi:MAG: hypothetical protein JWO91_1119 [Acidobacteriaceae bacterium]|nr:hypothetical protein [Acidobacteriaceae bacterium]
MKNLRAVLLLLCASASLPAQVTVAPSFFGMHAHSTNEWPAASFSSLRLWDTHTNWFQLCSSISTCDFSMLDSWLATANSNGIADVVYTFGHTPAWASSNPNDTTCAIAPGSCYPPDDVNPDGSGTDQAFKSFVTAITSHVGSRIQY